MRATAYAAILGARAPLVLVVLSGAGGCSSDECTMKLEAQRYDAAAMCRVAREQVGCVHADSCDDSTAWAVDSEGRCFFFSNMCIPKGFTILQFGNMSCPTTTSSVPECNR